MGRGNLEALKCTKYLGQKSKIGRNPTEDGANALPFFPEEGHVELINKVEHNRKGCLELTVLRRTFKKVAQKTQVDGRSSQYF